MVKGKRSLGVVWHESCCNLVLGEVEEVVQKMLVTALWPLMKS